MRSRCVPGFLTSSVLLVLLSPAWMRLHPVDRIPLAKETATLSGYVLNSKTGEGLAGANVFLVGTDLGAAATIEGYYVVSEIPPGVHMLEVTYVGFEGIQATLDLSSGEVQRRNFELAPKPVLLKEVEVSGERINRKTTNQMSRVKLDMRQLKSVPQLGEADLFRTLHSLPGVLTETEFSTGLVIRGGNTDQNLILLDGITVYNPSHLGGVFSNFILDAVKEVDLYKGGFNAEYGGRLSAVLNVRSREGNRKRFDGKATVSMVSAQTTLEGPIGNGAWLASARRTYFDKLFQGTDLYFPYYFYDFQGHVFQDLSEGDRISVSWYVGEDDLSWEEFLLLGRWGNETVSLHYRRLFGEKLVSRWLLARSRFDILFGLGGGSGLNETDYIRDNTFRSDWTYFASQNSQWRFGVEFKDLSFVYSLTYLDSAIFDARQSPLEGAVYGKIRQWVTPTVMIEPGIRLNYYSAHPSRWFLDPRLNLKWLLTPDRYLNMSVGIYHQFMAAVQDDYNPKVLDAWFAVDSSVKPSSSLQIILGYETYFSKGYRLQVEGYYKNLRNMMTFVDTRATVDEMIPDKDMGDLVDLGDGYAYGWELFLHKQYGRLNGWLSYSYSVAGKMLHGLEYFSNWDRRHAFSLVANYAITPKWEASVKWTHQGGQPYTPILGYYQEHLPWQERAFYQPLPGGRNSARYPPFHRLDLGLVRHFKVWGVPVDLFLQVINAYWRKNVFRYFYTSGSTGNGLDDDKDGTIDEADEGRPIRTTVTGFPIIPTLGVTVDF